MKPTGKYIQPELILLPRKARFWEPSLTAGWRRFKNKWPGLGWVTFQTRKERLLNGKIVIPLSPYVSEESTGNVMFHQGDYTNTLTHELMHILIKTNGGYLTSEKQDHWAFSKIKEDMGGF